MSYLTNKKNDVGQRWEDIYKNGDATYDPLGLPQIEKFCSTVEIRRLVLLLNTISGYTALEAGCGSGKFSLSLASHGVTVTAMDYTFSPLKNIGNLSLTVKIKPGKIKLLCGDIERIPVQDAAYDLVFNEGVIEHWLDVKDRACIIREMLRVVRLGGYVVITVPNGGHRFHERWERSGYPGYLKAPPMTLYDFKKLKLEMEEAGLKDVKVEGIQPFSSFNQWPNYSWLKYPIAILNRLPLPKSLRCKWGIHLVGIGRR